MGAVFDGGFFNISSKSIAVRSLFWSRMTSVVDARRVSVLTPSTGRRQEPLSAFCPSTLSSLLYCIPLQLSNRKMIEAI